MRKSDNQKYLNFAQTVPGTVFAPLELHFELAPLVLLMFTRRVGGLRSAY